MKITLKSGAILDITRSPFVISHKLFKSVVEELKTVDIKLGQTVGSIFEFDLTDEALNTAKNAILTLLSSQKIEDCIWECLLRATYNDKKIDRSLFDDENVMSDYLEIAKEVMVYNLAPFQKSLISLFPNSERLKKLIGSPSTK